MEELNAIPGKEYYLSMHRGGFGDYWCLIEVLEVKKVQKSYNTFPEYSIKYHKLTSPYDEYYEDYQRKTYSQGQFKPYARKVWVHGERPSTWNRRILEV